MLIKKLILKNYGPHKNTTIEFNEDNTIIVGDNGSGKTFVVNALETLLLNKAIRPDDVRHGETSTCIVLETDEFILQKILHNKSHKTMLITSKGTREFTGIRGFDEDILPITKCGTTVIGKVAVDSTFVKVSDQILPYIHSPKDLLVAIVGPYASIDFKSMCNKFDSELRSYSQIINTRKENIKVIDKYILQAETVENSLNTLDSELLALRIEINAATKHLLAIKTSSITQEIENTNQKINTLNTEIDRCNRYLKMLQLKVCPSCNRPL